MSRLVALDTETTGLGVLERLARLEAEATAGEWTVLAPEFDGEPGWVLGPREGNFRPKLLEGDESPADVFLAAALRNAAPVLLDIAEKAAVAARYPSSSRTALADLRAALSRLDEVNLP